LEETSVKQLPEKELGIRIYKKFPMLNYTKTNNPVNKIWQYELDFTKEDIVTANKSIK
jgi:hypothetical protein